MECGVDGSLRVVCCLGVFSAGGVAGRHRGGEGLAMEAHRAHGRLCNVARNGVRVSGMWRVWAPARGAPTVEQAIMGGMMLAWEMRSIPELVCWCMMVAIKRSWREAMCCRMAD